jgi:dipeptidyl aminopeptidase/acylaminoacyl peptidase
VKPIRGGLLSGVAVSLLLLALSPATSWAAFPGANGLIAGAGGGSEYWEIWTISPNGSDPTRLTDNAIDDAQPSWSADGRRLTFIRGDVYYGPTDVWTMRADGTNQRQVTHGPAYESSPSFSPGGGRIVMDRNGSIVKVRTDGTHPVRLTSGRGARDPVFSPGGKRIVFAGSPREDASSGIWIMRRDGTHKRLLANEARDPEDELDYLRPDFDPDGSHIVFERLVCVSHSCDSNDVLMRSNGRRKRFIGGGEEPVFSPNGRRLATRLVSCDVLTETCTSRLITMARDGSAWQTVSRSEDRLAPSISPSWQPIPEP